jgi:hypothetical protein
LTYSTESAEYYYLELSTKLGIQVILEAGEVEVDLCLPSSIPRSSKSARMPGIKTMEDIYQLVTYLGFEESIP